MAPVRLLDLFCCQGGGAAGYARAGFTSITGIDIDPQPRYPYPFAQADAVAYLKMLIDFDLIWSYDAIHASPPCQDYTMAQRIQGRSHPRLIEPIRELLIQTGKPYVIENVPGAPLINPIEICGAPLGLHTYRHRLFESNVPLTAPPHLPHDQPTVKMGRPVREGDFYHAVGNFSNVDYIRRDIGMPWANRDGLRESIPPAFTEHIGRQLIKHIQRTAATGHRLAEAAR